MRRRNPKRKLSEGGVWHNDIIVRRTVRRNEILEDIAGLEHEREFAAGLEPNTSNAALVKQFEDRIKELTQKLKDFEELTQKLQEHHDCEESDVPNSTEELVEAASDPEDSRHEALLKRYKHSATAHSAIGGWFRGTSTTLSTPTPS